MKLSRLVLTRYIFFGINSVLFWLLGCGSLGVGVWLYVTKTQYLSLAPASYNAYSAAGLCIAAGATVLVIGFVGCCGAWIESKCLLLTYFGFVLIIFVVEITAGVLGFMYKENVRHVIKQQMLGHLKSDAPYAHSLTAQDGSRVTWDRMQRDLKCCGVNNYTDWFSSKSTSKSFLRPDIVPPSCCDLSKIDLENFTVETCGVNAQSIWFKDGCLDKFVNWLLGYMHIVGTLGVVFGIIQVFGLVTCVLLLCAIRRREQSRQFDAIPLEETHSSSHLRPSSATSRTRPSHSRTDFLGSSVRT